MNIYLHELRSLRKTTLIWTLSIIALAALFLSVYSSTSSDVEGFKKILSGYPPTVRAMLGINLDYITSLVGFYSMVFSFVLLCGAVQAMNLGVSVLSKESRERTADFLLVKPVSRQTIVTAKILAAFTMIAVTDILFYAVTLLIANGVKTADYDGKVFLMINCTLFFVQLIFLGIGLAVSVFFKKLRNVLPISLGVVFGLYMVGALIATGKDDDAARYLSPFRYFDITYIIKHSAYEVSYMLAGAIIVVLSIIITYFVYAKKDIHAVS